MFEGTWQPYQSNWSLPVGGHSVGKLMSSQLDDNPQLNRINWGATGGKCLKYKGWEDNATNMKEELDLGANKKQQNTIIPTNSPSSLFLYPPVLVHYTKKSTVRLSPYILPLWRFSLKGLRVLWHDGRSGRGRSEGCESRKDWMLQFIYYCSLATVFGTGYG